jgi:hypothetical protein
MATAGYGNANRAAPDQFRGCAEIRRVTGQSPLPNETGSDSSVESLSSRLSNRQLPTANHKFTLPRDPAMMLLVAPRISCFPPGLNLITRFQVFGDGFPTTRFLGSVIAAGQAKRDKDQARASETNHVRRRDGNCARSNAVHRRSSNRNFSGAVLSKRTSNNCFLENLPASRSRP